MAEKKKGGFSTADFPDSSPTRMKFCKEAGASWHIYILQPEKKIFYDIGTTEIFSKFKIKSRSKISICEQLNFTLKTTW